LKLESDGRGHYKSRLQENEGGVSGLERERLSGGKNGGNIEIIRKKRVK